MSQNFNNYQGSPGGSPPTPMTNGYEGLMGSLISPRHGTPLQSGFPLPPWPPQGVWPQNMNYNMFQGPIPSQPAWQQNGQTKFISLENDNVDEELLTCDDTDVQAPNGHYEQQTPEVGGGDKNKDQGVNKQASGKSGQLPTLSSASPLALPQSRIQTQDMSNGGTASGPPTNAAATKSPMIDSATRAAELRAKLLANRASSASIQGSPGVKAKELREGKKANVQEVPQQTKTTLAPISQTQNSTSNPATRSNQGERAQLKPNAKAQDQSPGKMSVEVEELFDEFRNPADASKQQGTPRHEIPRDKPDLKAAKELTTNNVKKLEAATTISNLNPEKSASSSSEPGEIHSGADTSNKLASSPKGVEPRQDTQADGDTKEKLMRQTEVNKAYEHLEDSNQTNMGRSKKKSGDVGLALRQTGKPGPQQGEVAKKKPLPPTRENIGQPQKPLDKPEHNQNVDNNVRPPTQEESRREQQRERARAYDQREDTRDIYRPSAAQTYSRASISTRENEERRQRMTDENARRAAEYKQKLAQRPQSLPGPEDAQISVRETHPVVVRLNKEAQISKVNGTREVMNTPSATNNTVSRYYSARGEEADPSTILPSPVENAIDGNDDVTEWLELTGFHDEDYRERRLTLFRKKKALDAQREELEREEMELQGRPYVARAQSALPANISPKTVRHTSVANVKMPPPPLPLKEANNDGDFKIKDSALSAGLPTSGLSTPTLKRQRAEDETEKERAQSMSKLPRLETSRRTSSELPQTSPASAKDNSSRGEFISRDPSSLYMLRPRAPSRSPGPRRISPSPRRRRYSDEYSPDRNSSARYAPTATATRPPYRTCHNCGQPGHHVQQCTEPRRDGREWSSTAPAPSPGYQQWVSPNYRGRNPLPRGGGGGGSSGHHSPYVRGGAPASRSMYNSVDPKFEDGDGGGHENGRDIPPGGGGQTRR